MTQRTFDLAPIKRALVAAPGEGSAWHRFGLTVAASGEIAAAVPPLTRALSAEPTVAGGWESLGLALATLARWPAAAIAYRNALTLKPWSAEIAAALATALAKMGQVRESIVAFDRAIELAPSDIALRYDRANLRANVGDRRAAIADLQGVLARDPGRPLALFALGRCHGSLEELASAETWLRRTLAADGTALEALIGLATLAHARMDTTSATQSYRRALALAPDNVESCNNLAGLELLLGRVSKAVRHHRRATSCDPTWIEAHSNLLLALGYVDDLPHDRLFAEYRRWESRHARPHYAHIHPHANDPNPERRLRIGYLSADLFHHPIGANTVGLIENHDRTQVHVACYAEIGRADALTDHFRARADTFVETQGLGDGEVAERIRADRIDILVALAGHTGRNRLVVAARKPAPVQVSYADFSTTGMEVMDYWLTDPVVHPEGAVHERFTETLLRLPMMVLHHPIAVAPAVTSLPAPERGHVTFGSFNNPAKIGDGVIAAWSRILAHVPKARLLLKYRAIYEAPDVRRRILGHFAGHGIAADRIFFAGGDLDRPVHLALVGDMDIALDPFPFNGCTTTFEALWMGVPVVTMAGPRFLGRMGASFLHHCGLGELVATDIEDYVATAVNLARDLPRIAGLRAGLRERILASPLCDSPRYARSVEAAYRTIWQRWCDGLR